MDYMKSKFIIVWGMHRSGTSLIARSLKVFGASLGDNLFAGNPGNPKGYFEDMGLMQLDSAMLKELGLSWDSLAPVREKHVRHLIDCGYLEYAVNFLGEVGTRGAVVGLKDPRMTKLAPFWRKAFHEVAITPVNIVAYRKPQAVIASLARRALTSPRPGLLGDPLYGAYLWLSYTLASILYTSGFPRVLMNYEEFLDHPHDILVKTGDILSLPIDKHELDQFCNSFVDRRLNHDPGQKNYTFNLPPRINELYGILDSLPELCFPSHVHIGKMWPESESELNLCGFIDKALQDWRDMWRKQNTAKK